MGEFDYFGGGEQEPDIYTSMMNSYRESLKLADGDVVRFDGLPVELQEMIAELVASIEAIPEKERLQIAEKGDVPEEEHQEIVYNRVSQHYGKDINKACGAWNQFVGKVLPARDLYRPPKAA